MSRSQCQISQFRNWLEATGGSTAIFCDLDNTLVISKMLSDVVNQIPMPTEGSIQQRMQARKELRTKFDSMTEPELVEYWQKQGGKILHDGHDQWVTFLRPHAIDFIQALKQQAEVFVLTSGGTAFQKKVIRLHQLPVAGLFGQDLYGKIPKYERAILVDDLSINTSGVQEKLRAIHSPIDRDTQNEPVSNSFYQIQAWNNLDFNDNVLMSSLPAIQKMLI